MGQFVVRRLILMFFTLAMISLLVFAAVEMVPGDTAQMILGNHEFNAMSYCTPIAPGASE